MLLMIFVNDLWTLHNIRLARTYRAKEDGMGLADVVFPCFLFIVGSPFRCLRARIKKATQSHHHDAYFQAHAGARGHGILYGQSRIISP